MKRQWKPTLGLALGILAIIGAVLITRTVSADRAPSSPEAEIPLHLDDYQVPRQEFIIALDMVRSEVATSASVGQSSAGRELWQSTAKDSPSYRAAEQAIEVIRHRYSLYSVLADGGIVTSPDWDELTQRYRQVNEQREADKAAGKPVYGLTTFDLPTFLTYESGALTEDYIHNDHIPAMVVSEQAAQQHYDSKEWVIGREEEARPATFAEVRTNVVDDLRRHRFAALVADAEKQLSVHSDLEKLAELASQHYLGE